MITENINGYEDNNGYIITQYNKNFNVTGITIDPDDTDGMVPEKIFDEGGLIGYKYTNEEGVEFVYDVDSNGVTGYSETWTEADENNNSYSYTYKYNAAGRYIGHSYSDGKKIVTYDADGSFQESSITQGFELKDLGGGSFGYTDEFGVTTIFNSEEGTTVTGYSTTYEWDGGSQTTNYNASWEMTSTSITEGFKTTTYDNNWEVTGTIINYSGMGSGDVVGEYTIYTGANEWGTTKYYVKTKTPQVLEKYIETYTGNFTYTNENGQEVSCTYENSYTYDIDGDLLEVSSSNSESNGTNSSNLIYNYDVSGKLIGYSESNQWSNDSSSGTSETEYDAEWQVLSSTHDNTFSYIDENGATQEGTSSYSSTTNFAADNVTVTGYTTENIWGGDSQKTITEYDANWVMTSTSITKGAKTTTYDSNWKVTATTIDYDNSTMESEIDGEYTIYTETNEWGTTKYYVITGPPSVLEKYIETHTGSYTYTNENGQDISCTYENSDTYDTHGNVVNSSHSNKDDSNTYLSNTTYHYENSQLTGYTEKSEWSGENGSGTSTKEFDANGNISSQESGSTHTYSFTYFDSFRSMDVTVTGNVDMTNEFDDAGAFKGSTNIDTWSNTLGHSGERTSKYDSEGNMSSSNGIQSSTYDNGNGMVTQISTTTSTGDYDANDVYTRTEVRTWVEKDSSGEPTGSSGSSTSKYDSEGKQFFEESTSTNSHAYDNGNGMVTQISETTSTGDYDQNGGYTGRTEVRTWVEKDSNEVLTGSSGSSTSYYNSENNMISSNGTQLSTHDNGNGMVTQTSTTTSKGDYDQNGVYTGRTDVRTWVDTDSSGELIGSSGSSTSKFDSEGKQFFQESTFTNSNAYDHGNGMVTQTSETTSTGDYDQNGVYTGYTDVRTWVEKDSTGELTGSSGSSTSYYDSEKNMISSNGTQLSTHDNGNGMVTQTSEITSTGDYGENGVYTGRTEVRTWVETDSSGKLTGSTGSSTAKYDSEGKQFFEESTFTNSHAYDNGNGMVTQTSEITSTGDYGENGVYTGRTDVLTWVEADSSGELIGRSGSSTSYYNSERNIISSNGTQLFTYDNGNGMVTQTSETTSTGDYGENGVYTGRTDVRTWVETDSSGELTGNSGSSTSYYDSELNMISREDNYFDTEGNPSNTHYGFYMPSDSFSIVSPIFNGFMVDKIDMNMTIENVNAPVTGAVSEASFTSDINFLLSVSGDGFDSSVVGDISAAIVSANTGGLSGTSWVAIDANGSDTFNEGDYLIELSGTVTLTNFDIDVFI